MSDVREIPAVLESAAQAAASGDLAAAESLLQEVVQLQEFSLGPRHPDLASTFNNLAVVCEMANRPADAEQFYRRAYAIASATLDPHDPLVITSLNNLKEFCAARGVPLGSTERMTAESGPGGATVPRPLSAGSTEQIVPGAAATPEDRAVAAEPTRPAEPVKPDATPSAPARQTTSPRTVIIGAVATVVLFAALIGFCSREPADGSDASSEPAAAPSASSPAPAPAEPSGSNARAVSPAPREAGRVDPPVKSGASRPAPQGAAGIKVLEAKVCQSLSTEGAEWRCVATSSPAKPGRLSFYTRVAASQTTRVRHRWYRGDRLVQDVGLEVRANPDAGFRTYSRQTVSAMDGGEWRVEIRTPDGALLAEEHIVVR